MQKYFNKCTILCVVICSALNINHSIADDYFDPSLIEGNLDTSTPIDLSVFSRKGGQLAGTYFTSIYLNQNLVTNTDVKYEYIDNKDFLSPLLTKKEYIEFGVRKDATPNFSALADDDTIGDLSQVIPGTFFKYDFNQNKLDLSIPQIYMNRTVLGQVDEKLWNEGINALFTSYYYSGATTKYRGQSETTNNSYLNLKSGINLGAWRLRNYSTYVHSSNISKWNNLSNYLERNILSLKSRLTIGDSYTNSEMFDSFSFRGIKLTSDDAMLASSQRGFAPVIRNIAKSNAEITIRQNGVIIRQSYVPAGPFVIDDLYPTATSGDMEITIKEADGSSRTFIQPFSSVPIMLREGNFKYSLAAGEYRKVGTDNIKTPYFIQATGIYGLPYDTTIYNGSIISKDYQSLLVGLGKSLADFGSVSFDVSTAKSTLENQTDTGSSLRFQYSKDVLVTGTSFSFTSYRYSTAKYRDFSDVNDYTYNYWKYSQNRKDKFQFDINQNIGENLGNFHLTGYQERYWNKKGKSQNINASYNNIYQGISYALNYSYTKDDASGNKSKLFSLSLSIPFDVFSPTTNISVSSSIDDNNKTRSSVGLSGNVFDDNSLYYNMQAAYASKTNDSSSGSLSMNYRRSFGEYQVGYNYDKTVKQLNYSANGSVVLHPYGLTFGQPIAETFALIRAKNAHNLAVMNYTGIYTDGQGNAIVPYTSPYEKNTLSLDIKNMGPKIDLISNVKTVVPTRGAIVLADYPTQIGYKIFVKLTGVNIPFGALTTLKNEGYQSNGIVDDGQVVYLSGAPVEGDIQVTWSNGQCIAPYKLTNFDADIHFLSATCD
ncbi:fimbria/pilus outer membrane usher protein [Orbus wheelerorum]|uniref:fimbria/pilus outer membrane usher protein n=1 Tax=Orbus wheelerorum TaxID=3074111 RepID=UPI00370D1731